MFCHRLRSGEACLQKLDTLVQLWTRYAESVHVFAGERGRGLTPGAMVSDRPTGRAWATPTAIAKIVQRSGALAELL